MNLEIIKIQENNFKTYLKKENINAIMIEFKYAESANIVKSHFINMSNIDNIIIEFIPSQVLNRRSLYEKYAWQLRQQNQSTKIRIRKYDYHLISKQKGNQIPWSSLSPFI